MSKKEIVKFKGKDTKGAMHQVFFEDKYVSLTMRNSQKMREFLEEGKISIAPNLLSRDFEETKINIIDDKTFTKRVFDYMLEKNHTHYKEYNDNLIVIEYLI